MADPAKDTGRIDLPRSLPSWVIVLALAGGAGGLGLGGVQLARTPTDIGDKLDTVAGEVRQVSAQIGVLAAQMSNLATVTGRDQDRTDRKLDDHEKRLRALEERRAR